MGRTARQLLTESRDRLNASIDAAFAAREAMIASTRQREQALIAQEAIALAELDELDAAIAAVSA